MHIGACTLHCEKDGDCDRDQFCTAGGLCALRCDSHEDCAIDQYCTEGQCLVSCDSTQLNCSQNNEICINHRCVTQCTGGKFIYLVNPYGFHSWATRLHFHAWYNIGRWGILTQTLLAGLIEAQNCRSLLPSSQFLLWIFMVDVYR